MSADAPEPIGRIAGVGLSAMGNPMPVGGELAFAEVIGLLSRLMTGIPRIERLEQPRRECKSGGPRGFRNQPGQRVFIRRGYELWPAGLALYQWWAKVGLLCAQSRDGQRRDQVGRF
jgi:hypothetical protein